MSNGQNGLPDVLVTDRRANDRRGSDRRQLELLRHRSGPGGPGVRHRVHVRPVPVAGDPLLSMASAGTAQDRSA